MRGQARQRSSAPTARRRATRAMWVSNCSTSMLASAPPPTLRPLPSPPSRRRNSVRAARLPPPWAAGATMRSTNSTPDCCATCTSFTRRRTTPTRPWARAGCASGGSLVPGASRASVPRARRRCRPRVSSIGASSSPCRWMHRRLRAWTRTRRVQLAPLD